MAIRCGRMVWRRPDNRTFRFLQCAAHWCIMRGRVVLATIVAVPANIERAMALMQIFDLRGFLKLSLRTLPGTL